MKRAEKETNPPNYGNAKLFGFSCDDEKNRENFK